MKIKNKKSTVQRTTLSVIIVLFLLLAAFAAWYFFTRDSSVPNKTLSQSNAQQAKVNEVDYGPAKESDSIAKGSAKDELAAPEKDDGATQNGVTTITLTTAQQQGDTVLIRTIIEGTTSGTCTMTASKAGQASIVKSAPVGTQAHYSLCQGFNIATADFPASGIWTIQVSLSSNNSSAYTKATALEVNK